jgi:Domain of unknown function (DUF6457)
VHEWLTTRADALSRETEVPRERLDLTPEQVDTLLDIAGHAAHDSGARTNAPLLCYLLGLSAGAKSLDELVEIVRSTS